MLLPSGSVCSVCPGSLDFNTRVVSPEPLLAALQTAFYFGYTAMFCLVS
jgi:hypothetical protein